MTCSNCGDSATGKLCSHCGAVLTQLQIEAGNGVTRAHESVEAYLARGGVIHQVTGPSTPDVGMPVHAGGGGFSKPKSVKESMARARARATAAARSSKVWASLRKENLHKPKNTKPSKEGSGSAS